MLERFPSRLAVEANTPVVEVDYQPETEGNFSYLVQTGRGTVRCKKVVYCTNAYTGRLLPALRGLLFPLKGTMTVQDLGVAVDNTAPSTSWAIHYAPFEEKDGTLADGLIYGIQNSRTGQYFFGGEKTAVSDMLSTDDTFVSQSSVAFLQDSLRTLFVQDSESETTASDLVASWSGIMCFSSDGMPLVGRLSESVTGRKGSEEWLCCAYSGYGMPVAWLAGENLAAMILDKPLHEHFPESYLITEKRLRDKLSLQKSVEHLLEI
jgi:glycine/D-amino acid oxidase-like deaminating enzyme